MPIVITGASEGIGRGYALEVCDVLHLTHDICILQRLITLSVDRIIFTQFNSHFSISIMKKKSSVLWAVCLLLITLLSKSRSLKTTLTIQNTVHWSVVPQLIVCFTQ